MATPTYEYSGVCYTATAGQTTFALTTSGGNSIGYLKPEHIQVRTSVDNGGTWTGLSFNSDWVFADPATSIVLNSAAAADQLVDIRRETPMDEDWIVFQVGSLLTAGQLNEFETWQLYIDQELSDLVANLTAPDINLADTDDLPEGSTNLYYTDARVEAYVSGEGYYKGTPGDGTITINQGGVQKGQFTVDQSGNTTINLEAGGAGGSGVTRIIAGSNIGIIPSSGVGEVTISAAGGGGGTGGIPEAPLDGNLYGRQSAGWTSIVVPASPVQSDWDVNDSTSLAFIKNKPNWVQSDWAETDASSFAFIENKPTLNLQTICDGGNTTTTTIQAAGFRIDQLETLP